MSTPTTVHGLPVRDAAAARARPVERARLAAPEALAGLLARLHASIIQDGVDDFLDRILSWEARPLGPLELQTLVDRLHSCLWPLVTDALHAADGHPDRYLRQLVAAAGRLDTTSIATEFIPTQSHARLLASLIVDLMDLVSDDQDTGPGPGFEAGRPQ
ncbi:DUF6415 family natural product biosynthesis protein [Streptomyces sp. NPDC057638]|uniref:DUF6415 family natural product biosynthesis protein n=1 Tax=Streptomyces sp. NPDC057638 TaxID=3346190 RepID=UPI0036B3F802